MRFRLLPVVLVPLAVACEPMSPTGTPFAPVSVEQSPAPLVPVAPAASARASEGDGVIISKEESVGGKPSAKAVTDPLAPATSGGSALIDAGPSVAPGGATPTPATATTAPAVAAPASPATATTAPGASLVGWPIRVVATVPNAQPPRAILGLPDGQEMVVSPGSMVPAAGIVVIAIGANSVEVAEILPTGDRAVVKPRTLQSLR